MLWRPSPDAARTTTIGRFAHFVTDRTGVDVGAQRGDYDALWRWSTTDIDGFWSAVWEFFKVRGDGEPTPVRVGTDMLHTRWFPGTELNWAEHALGPQWADEQVAVVAASQTRPTQQLTAGELRREVARVQAGLVRLGVRRGDRVAAYLPNISETLVALLATASLGAIWSSCAPEFGVRSVVDRFAQIEPTVLLAVDGYRYGDKVVDRRGELEELRQALPDLAATVVVSYLDPQRSTPPGTLRWDELGAEDGPLRFDGLPRSEPSPRSDPWSHAGDQVVEAPTHPEDAARPEEELAFERVPFAHPLYVLYSSGTTGLPKPIVHGHGGILLTHLRDLALQQDMGNGDRFFWFTTTGWMMWNYLVSGLTVGATVVLFDGDPGYPDLGTLWQLAEDVGITVLGVSAPYLMACRRAGLEPARTFDLHRLRSVACTGAPLPAAGFEWVAQCAAPGRPLAAISGGTDICSAFIGHAPTVPVWAGEMSCRVLGAAVAAFDPDGHPVIGSEGELVVTAPFPSMPVGLWGDPDRSRYRDTYFATYPGIWRHGDWLTITERGSCIISGRSDATLNRGGVRIGTAEIYAVVEDRPEVADSLVVHLEDPAGGPGELVLFVVPAPGHVVDDDLRRALVSEVRRSLSPRHVPDRILAVAAVPRTLSGKKLEVPVKKILQGADPQMVAAAGALANPESLIEYQRATIDR